MGATFFLLKGKLKTNGEFALLSMGYDLARADNLFGFGRLMQKVRGFDLSEWKETLGYLVAENKLTQDNLIDLLTRYLHEISFLGMDPEEHQDKVDEIATDLETAMEDIREGGHTVPAEEVLDELMEEHGLLLDKWDAILKKLSSEILDAEMKYSRYCNWRERSRILKSLGYTAPSFEEAENKKKEAEDEKDDELDAGQKRAAADNSKDG